MKLLIGVRFLSLCLVGAFLLTGNGDAEENAAPSSSNIRLETRKLLRAADAEYQQGNLDKALVHLDSVLSLDPSNPDGYYLKGKIILTCGDTSAAHEILVEATQKAPRSNRIKLLLARIHLEQGHWEEPLTLTRSVLAIKPLDGEAMYLLGWGLFLSGDTAQTIEIFEQVLAKELDGAGQ